MQLANHFLLVNSDVRMLGNGRPFVVQITNAKLPALSESQLKDLEARINANANDLIAVRNLRMVSNETYTLLKNRAETHNKSYRCVVVADRDITAADIAKINSTPDFTIFQNTPVRVMHRRTLMSRDRKIFSLKVHHQSSPSS